MHEKPLRCRSLPGPVGEAYSVRLASYLDLEGRDSRAWEWKESKGLEMGTKGRNRRKGRELMVEGMAMEGEGRERDNGPSRLLRNSKSAMLIVAILSD